MEEDPYIVFTSTEPGLVAAREILEDTEPGSVLFLRPKEFEDWVKIQPDAEYRWHVHYWSYFRTEEAEADAALGEAYPLKKGERFWIHCEGTMCGELFGRGADHLWLWNGSTPVLLEEGINMWVS